jgi:asparagine synthase (glutamine-hydrolysing)
MCGIAGAIGMLDAEILAGVRLAAERERHRGPDAEGFWASAPAGPGVAFAHRRLAIIDLSEDGVQPMSDPNGDVVIVFNGEIYNYRTLRAELESQGVHFKSKSDTEVLLQAYLRWGDDFLARLTGMFAFALWDRRTRRVLFARDRLGIKPVYLARVRRPGGDVLLFASELRALLATGLIERKLDPLALETYLWHGFVAGPDALARGVRRLEPGTALSISLDTLEEREWRFWTLPPFSARPDADAIERLRDTLEDAVRIRLIADVPLGVFLSGGIDSSAISALAARAAPGQLRTFSVGFEELAYDESPYARQVAQHLGAEHTEVRLSQSSFVARLDDAIGCLDQPSFDAINTYFVSRAVREAGITVALAGTGGDELFGGYPSFVDLPRIARASQLAGFLPQALVRGLAQAIVRWKLGDAGDLAPQARWGKLPDALALRGQLVDLYQLACSIFTRGFLSELAPGLDWSRTRHGLDPSRCTALARAISGSPPLHAVSILELASFVGERLLPDTDTASMAVSLEVRVPLLDHRVVEQLARTSLDRRFQPLGRKQLLRDLALGDLPKDLFDRPKRGFELPMRAWMTGSTASSIGTKLRERIDATFADTSACAAAGLSPGTVARLWRAFLDDRPGLYWSRPWALFVLLDWCRRERIAL